MSMIIFSCALGITLPALAVSFTFTTFPAPGAKQTVASGINAAWQMVGNFKDAGGKIHGYLRTAEGTFTTIDAPGAM